ncbi:MAG TPA: hypothetical protein DCQ31_13790 [Bacteroidales bacterium]|nr:hypothetical protein [Bacteroidales bacterium]
MKFQKILIILLLFFYAKSWSQPIADSVYLNAILNNDLTKLEKLLETEKNPNKLMGKQQFPLLYFTLITGKESLTQLLKNRGADINFKFQNKTILKLAVFEENITNIELFVKNGANINQPDSAFYTPLMSAVKYRNTAAVSTLINLGANIHYATPDSLTVLDVAIIYGYPEIRTFLLSQGAKRTRKKTVNFVDGPHLKFTPEGNLTASELKSDENGNTKRLNLSEPELQNYASFVPAINKQNASEYMNSIPQPSIYSDVEKIIAVGDVHGNFDQVSNLLINNQVIDSAYNWTWGKGHLVFIGDIFDRGEKVTQTLWLIVKLSLQAQQAGGNVHLLLGNHELLALTGDYRYLHKNYYNLCNNLAIEYAELFNDSSFLGKFIRKSKIAVTINGNLFVHAGISPEIANNFESVEQINQFAAGIFQQNDSIKQADLLRSFAGPLWYRGFIGLNDGMPTISNENIENITHKYQVKRIISGHTEVEEIKFTHNRQFIGINKPFRNAHESEALYIENGKFFRATSDGKKTRLK